MRVGIVVTAIAAALLGACSGIGGGGSPSSSKPATPGPGERGTVVAGSITQLSSGKVVVNEQPGTATVAYDDSTMVLQSGTGTAADVAAGTCVTANGQRDSAGAITASAVQVMLNMNGQCSLLQQPANASPRPFPSGSPGQGRGPGGAGANNAFVRGKVTAVNGSTITVQQAANDNVTVTVPSTARITKIQAASASRLTVGLCVQANGQRDSSGTLKARQLTIVPPGPNGCTGSGAPRSPQPGRPSPRATSG